MAFPDSGSDVGSDSGTPSTVDLPDLAATGRLAGALAPLGRRGDVIALEGDLGAGKTTFARAFLEALGIDEDVPSPTFSLVQVYDTASFPVWHFDLYRLNAPDEVWELGFEEALDEGLSLIEWPERLGPLLPADRLHLAFRLDGRGRHVTVTRHGRWATRQVPAT
jgi:tRNA threonylcarbamoyladenosine biosynthesis protein TsaE